MYYLRLAHMIQNNTFFGAKSIDERFILDGQTYKLISIGRFAPQKNEKKTSARTRERKSEHKFHKDLIINRYSQK